MGGEWIESKLFNMNICFRDCNSSKRFHLFSKKKNKRNLKKTTHHVWTSFFCRICDIYTHVNIGVNFHGRFNCREHSSEYKRVCVCVCVREHCAMCIVCIWWWCWWEQFESAGMRRRGKATVLLRFSLSYISKYLGDCVCENVFCTELATETGRGLFRWNKIVALIKLNADD